ncbi:MAG: Uma2 family endonuclease [Bacteroidota bacterium]
METLIDKRLITREEYYKMAESGILAPDEKVELINGEIINKMSPIGSKHAAVLERLASALRTLDEHWLVRTQNPVMINGISEPEPDIAVVEYTSDFYAENHPTCEQILFLIEVADSSLHYDQTTKKELYASGGISEYWVIDINSEHVEVYTALVGNRYTKTRVYADLNQNIPVGDQGRSLKVQDVFSKS